MCGIVGYVGKKNDAKEVLLDGLKHLEYRGYDSAGIALVLDGQIKVVKSLGRIVNLEEAGHVVQNISKIGIGHTRWATHGVPSVGNAHPHQVGKITLVHNGIIENFEEIRMELIEHGYQFQSETDTEVACAYIDFAYQQTDDMKLALKIAQKRFRGSYAFGILNSDEMDMLYAVRKDSPLIVGIGDDQEYYIASDVPAILKYTNQFIDLENHELVCMEQDGVTVYNSDLEEISKEVNTFEGDIDSAEKNGYETFMLKEMYEQPKVVERTIHDVAEQSILDTVPSFTDYDQIDIVACGSAYHAGLVGKSLLEGFAGIPVNVHLASEYQYQKHFYQSHPLLVLISQSGETADTKKCMEQANAQNVDTLAIVNVNGSSIARGSKNVLYTKAGPEIAVATTKAYSAQITLLSLIAMNIAEKRNVLEMKDVLQDLKVLDYMKELIDQDYVSLAQKIYQANDIYFIGRGIDYALSMEGSLKLKEISYIHSEAYAAGELKHGTISLIDDGTPVIAIATDDTLWEKTVSNAKEVKARGAKVILVTTDDKNLVGDFCDETIMIPKVHPMLQPLLTVLPLQRLAYEVAKLRGCDIDKPKNLAKSVTVE